MPMMRKQENHHSAGTSAGRGLPARWSKQQRKNLLTFLLFASPALIWFAVIMVSPFVEMFSVSLQRWRGIANPRTFTGLTNFITLFQDPRFFRALENTGIQIAFALPATMILSFLIGFFLSRRPRGYHFFSIILFTPSMISAVAIAMAFMGIYSPDGIINIFLKAVGLGDWIHYWLNDKATALPALILMDMWSAVGFYGILFYVALSAMSDDLYEAASLDGASVWTYIWKIVFPINLNFFGVMSMLYFFGLLTGSAQIVLLLTRGGPGDATLTLSYLLYEQAFFIRNLGYSQAIGVVLFVLGFAGMFLIRAATNRKY
jgi:multiple sugar transport system permease protein